MATYLNAAYFFNPYPSRPRCDRKTVAFFSGCAWPGGTALGLLARAAVLPAPAACWTDSANARGASFVTVVTWRSFGPSSSPTEPRSCPRWTLAAKPRPSTR